MHGKAVEREQRLKRKLQALRAKVKELRQRLRERWARRRGSEKRTRTAGATEAAVAAPARRRGQQRGAAGHGRRGHAHLPVRVEAHEVDPEQRRCPACGAEYHAHGSEDSEQLEIEVRAYRRVIKRRSLPAQLPVRDDASAAHGDGAGTADPEGHPGHLDLGDGADRQVPAVSRRTGCWRIYARMGWILPKAPSPTACAVWRRCSRRCGRR